MKKTNKQQIRSGLLLNKILNTTSTCIFWKDARRRFIGVNQAFLDYYGFTSEDELIGKTDEDMGWHSDPDPFQNDEWRILKNGESTFRVHGKCIVRGQERDILASKSPIYEAGKIIGLVGTFEDVTSDYMQKDAIRKLTETLANDAAIKSDGAGARQFADLECHPIVLGSQPWLAQLVEADRQVENEVSVFRVGRIGAEIGLLCFAPALLTGIEIAKRKEQGGGVRLCCDGSLESAFREIGVGLAAGT